MRPACGRGGISVKPSARGLPQLVISAAGARPWRGCSQPGPQPRIASGALEPKSPRRPLRIPAATSVLSARRMTFQLSFFAL